MYSYIIFVVKFAYYYYYKFCYINSYCKCKICLLLYYCIPTINVFIKLLNQSKQHHTFKRF